MAPLDLAVMGAPPRAGRLRTGIGLRRRAAVSLPAVVLASRLLVLVAGVAGGLLLHRVSGWADYDPGQLTARLGTVGNLLTAGSVRWDSIWYVHIAQHGYDSAAATAFFPLYPLLIGALSFSTASAVIAGMTISLLAFGAAMFAIHRLACLETDTATARLTVLLLAFAPVSLYFGAVYSESLFLALSAGAALLARRERWGWAGVLAGLAAATRIDGVLLVVLVLLPRRERRFDRRRLWMLLAPAGLGAYLGGLWLGGFSPLAPLHAQSAITHGHRFVGPLAALGQAVSAAGGGLRDLLTARAPLFSPGALASPLSAAGINVLEGGVLMLALAALIICLRRLPLAYGLYAGLALLVAVWSPVPGEPLKSLDRYVLTIFPLWIAGASWLRTRALPRVVLPISAALLAAATLEFTTWAFLS
jgi:hypothetical protein